MDEHTAPGTTEMAMVQKHHGGKPRVEPKKKKVNRNICLSQETWDKIDKLTQAPGQSVSGFIQQVLEKHLGGKNGK